MVGVQKGIWVRIFLEFQDRVENEGKSLSTVLLHGDELCVYESNPSKMKQSSQCKTTASSSSINAMICKSADNWFIFLSFFLSMWFQDTNLSMVAIINWWVYCIAQICSMVMFINNKINSKDITCFAIVSWAWKNNVTLAYL